MWCSCRTFDTTFIPIYFEFRNQRDGWLECKNTCVFFLFVCACKPKLVCTFQYNIFLAGCQAVRICISISGARIRKLNVHIGVAHAQLNKMCPLKRDESSSSPMVAVSHRVADGAVHYGCACVRARPKLAKCKIRFERAGACHFSLFGVVSLCAVPRCRIGGER